MSTTTEIKTVNKESWASKRAWLVILLFALGFSAWSLFTMARSLGAPTWLAIGASAVFDGAAIVLGDQAHRARLEGDSALAERLTVVALVGCSAWLNWQHARHVGWGSFGLLPAAAPVVAEVLFELRTKFAHRLHLRAQGLVAPRLVPLGRWAWIVFPGRAWAVIKSQISGRLDAIEEAANSGELLMNGGWVQVEARAVQTHGRPAQDSARVDEHDQELPAAPRPALPASAPVDLSGVFRLTPVAEMAATQAPATPAPVPFLAPSAVPQTVVELDEDDEETAETEPSPVQVEASLPESETAPVRHANVRTRVAAAHSKPARRANQITARIGGADTDQAARIWRETQAPNGGRLSSRQLAELTGLSQSTCTRLIAQLKKAGDEVAA